MSHLHTVNKSSHLADCREFIRQGDALVLMEDGVYSVLGSEIEKIPKAVTVYCLQVDIDARGIGQYLPDFVRQIGFVEFVRLCCDHDKVINWF